MFCENCGAELVKGKCPACGRVNEEAMLAEAEEKPAQAEKNIVAILGFAISFLATASAGIYVIFSFIGFLNETAGVLILPLGVVGAMIAVVGMVISSIGLKKAKYVKKGKALAIFGIIASSLAVVADVAFSLLLCGTILLSIVLSFITGADVFGNLFRKLGIK